MAMGFLGLGWLVFGQHVLDWREWHVPFSIAEWNRFRLWAPMPPHEDYPCLIVGRGGSGKSTLAQIMENSYLRRKFFKPRGFRDLVSDDELVARNETQIGGEVSHYQISWRPNKYRVGRLAEAYDMPGQITEDWVRAIEDVKKCGRVAIFNVVTHGCNNYIQKFDVVDSEDKARKLNFNKLNDRELIEKGVFPIFDANNECWRHNGSTCAPKDAHGKPSELLGAPKRPKKQNEQLKKKPHICEEYLQTYQEVYREKELKDFFQVVCAIKEHWTGKKKPKLLLVHIVNMANYWVDMRQADWREQADHIGEFYLKDKSIKIEDQDLNGEVNNVKHTFKSLNEYLRDNFDCKIAALPASFQFGKILHESYKDEERRPLVIFDSEWDAEQLAEGNFDKKKEWGVAKQALLANMTIKTLRALRWELYRPNRICGPEWSAASFGHIYLDKNNKNKKIKNTSVPCSSGDQWCESLPQKAKTICSRLLCFVETFLPFLKKKPIRIRKCGMAVQNRPHCEVVYQSCPDIYDRWMAKFNNVKKP